MTKTFYDALSFCAENLNLTLSDAQAETLFDFYQTVVDYNEKVNLTAVTDEIGFIGKHIADSLSAASLLTDGAQVADVGAGAGFPSVPLKILRPDLSFTLIEATGKKVDFINYAVTKLGLSNISAVHLRAEEAGTKAYRASFDFALSRAVGKINLLLEYGAPLLKTGGALICYKGPDLTDLTAAENAEKKLYCRRERVIPYTLPFGDGERNLVVYKKLASTPSIYPRPSAVISKKPL